MTTYETLATVGEQGRVLVAETPFAEGTEVEITISPKLSAKGTVMTPDDAALAASRARMRNLFCTIKGFRNSPRIPREELYERGSLR